MTRISFFYEKNQMTTYFLHCSVLGNQGNIPFLPREIREKIFDFVKLNIFRPVRCFYCSRILAMNKVCTESFYQLFENDTLIQNYAILHTVLSRSFAPRTGCQPNTQSRVGLVSDSSIWHPNGFPIG